MLKVEKRNRKVNIWKDWKNDTFHQIKKEKFAKEIKTESDKVLGSK